MSVFDTQAKKTHFDELIDKYIPDNDIIAQKGLSEESKARLNSYDTYRSKFSRLYIINVLGINPDDSKAYKTSLFEPKNFVDLCNMQGNNAQLYEPEDFLYCKNSHYPINKMITLRRFAMPVTDNIYDNFNQNIPDISRMVTFFDQETNKLEELLKFSYGMNWREMEAEFESITPQNGDASGFSGFSKKLMSLVDPTLVNNRLQGENRLNYDPKQDANKIFGAVDSINKTHYRDVGLNFTKDFNLVFEYELRSYNGITPEFAMKDIIANILSTTFNDGKFWGGSRYYVGERPSQYTKNFQFLNPDSIDNWLTNAYNGIRGFASELLSNAGGSKLALLKQTLKNGLAVGLGKILDKVGRPSIPIMNSLLSGEPTGLWHVTIGNPDNPIMVIGNLILKDVEVTFPTDSLSFGDFPTKIRVEVTLSSGMGKDRAGIEMMFNKGKSRLYFPPKKIKVSKGLSKSGRNVQSMEDNISEYGASLAYNTFSFLGDKVKPSMEWVDDQIKQVRQKELKSTAKTDLQQRENTLASYNPETTKNKIHKNASRKV